MANPQRVPGELIWLREAELGGNCTSEQQEKWLKLLDGLFKVPNISAFSVAALNSLYIALGNPPLIGWLPIGGDPCGLAWQGVQCVNTNVTGIDLNGVNLGGQLSNDLGSLSSIIFIDMSNNQIGGSIPSSLPPTIRTLSLSDNQLTGNIPDAISSLGQLEDLNLQNNHLNGPIPDAFQLLHGLTTMNLSGNALNGQLPPSMGNLTSLARLHLENNLLSGILDVLEDLPLAELNIENNLFSGPIPDKLLDIPDFRKDGNPFNTSVLPSPPGPSPSPSPSPSAALPPEIAPGPGATGPSIYQPPPLPGNGGNTKKPKASKGITWVTVAGILAIAVLAFVLCFFVSRYCCKRRRGDDKITKRHEIDAYSGPRATFNSGSSFQKPNYQSEPVRKDTVMKPETKSVWDLERNNMVTNLVEAKQEMDAKRNKSYPKLEDHKIDMTGMGSSILAPPPPPFPLLPSGMVTSDPMVPLMSPSRSPLNLSKYVKTFTIASLQQYTDSFSQENLIGKGMLGTVYKAELPTGKTLAVKKLDIEATKYQSDREFLELVSSIAKLKHENIIQLVGYCVEHRQRILVYEYCENGTLHEALHLDDDLHRILSWNTRIRLALQAAKALEYLHETNQQPIVHRNFKSSNILLDDELSVYVADSGLAPLLSSNSMSQLQSCGYGGPELELGNYTYKSDVYSFGVVMLELLTGKKPYDSSRPRGEQFLVRWAIPRLHDIDALSRMVDPSLKGAYSTKSLSRFADIISMCIQPEPEFRPSVSEIVENLVHMLQRDR
ncbi:OLC1v1021628C1 [Oldenlandia corymbosa var. corymbosa]|uniref:OLC1v1021628C1 n=1 Tax=Oldenlandia corymbosa var. corymbosa TaxID=529605 RepID=A0AAV1BW31_OLDCO|nr:OLC1v1021628C1 [Oldenlandia corymbosa var. corymbosa]